MDIVLQSVWVGTKLWAWRSIDPRKGLWMLEWCLLVSAPCCQSCGLRGYWCSEIIINNLRSASGSFLLCPVSSSPSAALSDRVYCQNQGRRGVLHLLHDGYTGYRVFLLVCDTSRLRNCAQQSEFHLIWTLRCLNVCQEVFSASWFLSCFKKAYWLWENGELLFSSFSCNLRHPCSSMREMAPLAPFSWWDMQWDLPIPSYLGDERRVKFIYSLIKS